MEPHRSNGNPVQLYFLTLHSSFFCPEQNFLQGAVETTRTFFFFPIFGGGADVSSGPVQADTKIFQDYEFNNYKTLKRQIYQSKKLQCWIIVSGASNNIKLNPIQYS